MKILLKLPIFLFSFQMWAQQTLDTIYANEHKNVALFFPKTIRQGIVGNDDFVFTYDREQQQYFGLLQARPGEESNLLAITNDGQVYSYILKYSKELPKLNYFVNNMESIGNERPMKKIMHAIKEPPIPNREDFLKRACNHLLKSTGMPIAVKRKNGVRLKLEKMAYYNQETYLVMEISNRSDIDFEVKYLNIYKVNGNNRRRASYQKLALSPIYKYGMPNLIKKGQSQRFVYVLPKFVLGDGERLMFELKESNGNRKVQLLR